MQIFRNNIKLLISISLTLGILYIFYKEWKPIISTLKDCEKQWVIAGLICYLANYIFRAYRIILLTNKPLKQFPSVFYTTSLHGFSTYMLPMKTGELALPIMLRNIFNIPFIEGSKILIKARLLDITVIGIYILTTTFAYNSSKNPSFQLAYAFTGIVLISFPFAMIYCTSTKLSKRLFRGMHYLLPTSLFKINELFFSLLIWACIALCLYCTAHSIGINITIWNIWFLIGIQLPMQLLPIQGIASTGNHEGGWTAALLILGYTSNESINYAMTSHTILLLYVLSLLPILILSKLVIKKC